MNNQSFSKAMAVGVVLAAVLGVAVAGGSQSKTSHTEATALQWMDSGFGPEVSPVDRDFSKGRHVTYVKFSAGMTTPLHTHSHDYVGIVLSGVSMHWEPGKPATRKQLSAGAHWYMPANVEHVSECLPGTECIMAIIQQDAMDFLPVKP